MNDVEAWWRERYTRIHATEQGREALWLDYSSDEGRGMRLQAQTFGLVLSVLGRIDGARVLDAGCGWGRLSAAMAAMGAHVTGVDLMDEMLAPLRAAHPEVRWAAGTFLESDVLAPLGAFDRIIAVETFQCAGPPRASLRALWSALAPGGRIVITKPNAACPIVQRSIAALGGKLFADTAEAMIDELRGLPGIGRFALRPLRFAEDQWVAPYELGEWSATGLVWPEANRMMIVADRA